MTSSNIFTLLHFMRLGGWFLLLLAGLVASTVFAQETEEGAPGVSAAPIEDNKTAPEGGITGNGEPETTVDETPSVKPEEKPEEETESPEIVDEPSPPSVQPEESTTSAQPDPVEDPSPETTVTEEASTSSAPPDTETTTSSKEGSTSSEEEPESAANSDETTESTIKSTTSEFTTSQLTTKASKTSPPGEMPAANSTENGVEDGADGNDTVTGQTTFPHIEDLDDSQYYWNYNDTVEEETEDPMSPSFRSSLIAAFSTLLIVALM